MDRETCEEGNVRLKKVQKVLDETELCATVCFFVNKRFPESMNFEKKVQILGMVWQITNQKLKERLPQSESTSKTPPSITRAKGSFLRNLLQLFENIGS
jgi:hypothetical protein